MYVICHTEIHFFVLSDLDRHIAEDEQGMEHESEKSKLYEEEIKLLEEQYKQNVKNLQRQYIVCLVYL